MGKWHLVVAKTFRSCPQHSRLVLLLALRHSAFQLPLTRFCSVCLSRVCWVDACVCLLLCGGLSPILILAVYYYCSYYYYIMIVNVVGIVRVVDVSDVVFVAAATVVAAGAGTASAVDALTTTITTLSFIIWYVTWLPVASETVAESFCCVVSVIACRCCFGFWRQWCWWCVCVVYDNDDASCGISSASDNAGGCHRRFCPFVLQFFSSAPVFLLSVTTIPCHSATKVRRVLMLLLLLLINAAMMATAAAALTNALSRLLTDSHSFIRVVARGSTLFAFRSSVFSIPPSPSPLPLSLPLPLSPSLSLSPELF